MTPCERWHQADLAARYNQRNDLEYTFFQTYFQNFGNKIFNNFCIFSQIPMKYHHFDITPIKITEIL